MERCAEWNTELWAAFIAFSKAFDAIEHDMLFAALSKFGVDASYVNFLKVLYRNQCLTVRAGVESREFEVGRGVMQGDPVSAYLFVIVMDVVFKQLKDR